MHSSMETNLEYKYTDNTIESYNGLIAYLIRPDLSVEHWKQFIDYGYVEWLMAMGGLSSLCFTGFVFVASLIAMAIGSNFSMGLLPRFSFTFYNYEKVQQMSELMNKR